MATTVETPEETEVSSYVDEEFIEFFKQIVQRNKDVSTEVVPSKLAREILTEKRIELINKIREEDQIESKRDLARKLDRDIKAVSRDLDTLWKYGIIDYTKEKNRKIPELTADKIIIEPL